MDGTKVLLSDAEGTVVLAVNESAAALWELCDGTTSAQEMAVAISELAGIPLVRAVADVRATLIRFEQAGLVSFGDRPGEAIVCP